MADRNSSPCCCNMDWEKYNPNGHGFIGGEFRTDSPWHCFNFTNDPNGDGDFIEIDVNFCPFCGAKLVKEINYACVGEQGEKNIKEREEYEIHDT